MNLNEKQIEEGLGRMKNKPIPTYRWSHYQCPHCKRDIEEFGIVERKTDEETRV